MILKHFTFTLILLFSIQNAVAQGFRGELLAGIATSQVSGDQLSGFDKVGGLLGGGVKLSTGNKTEVGFRMFYVQKGSRKPSNLSNGDPTFYLLRLNYIEMPLSCGYKFNKKWKAEAGLSVAYLFKSKEEDENGELVDTQPFEKIDFSMFGGVTYAFNEKIGVQVHYWQSLLPIRSTASGESFRLNAGQYNSVFTLNLIYSLSPKK